MDNGSTRLYNTLMGNPNYNAVGRTAGSTAGAGDSRNFFQKRWDSIKNAFGTTGAAIASAVKDSTQNTNTDLMLVDNQAKMQNIVKKYGYKSLDDYYNDLDNAEINDKERYNQLLNTVQAELKGQSAANMDAMRQNQADYKDWVDNNYASTQLKQDRGKFLGSAINTLSTGVDLAGLSATPLANSIQGGIEGVADELEQNGGMSSEDIRDWFGPGGVNWEQAGKNAAIGATTGAVTGALNKGISNKLAKNGGNLFKGNNALTRGMNELGSKTALGRIGSTIATGAGRGAVSGAVGGATGAGMSALFNGGDVIGSALEGAKQGAVQGATTGGIMAGANMAISKTPGVGKFYNDLQSAKTRWDQSGGNFNERLTNTITSGESGVGNWLNRQSNSKLLNSLGNVGNSIQDVSRPQKYVGVDTLGNRTEYTPEEFQRLLQEYDDTYSVKDHSSVLNSNGSSSEVEDVVGRAGGELMNIYKTMNGGVEVNPYNRQSWEQFDDWVANQRQSLRGQTPTTAKGWLKRAGERIVEDANDRGVGLGIKDVGQDMPDDVRNLKINNWDETPETDAMTEEVVVPNKTRTQSAQIQQGDAWDRVAQQAGYKNYDDVIEAYMQANPNTPLNPRGAAGQILTWMDENPNTPTTAAGWAKRAGQRIVEDANERGVGLGIKNVAQETPETEVYRRLTIKQETPEIEVDEISPKTSKESRLRYAQGMELLRQYGAVDTPTANSMNAPEVFQEIADMGFTKPGDVEKIANEVTGSHGAVSKLTKNVVKNAAPVDTFTGANGEPIEDFIDNSIELNSLYDTPQGNAIKRTVQASLRSLPSRAEGSISYTDTAEDTFKLVQNLEKKAAELEGRGGTRYSRPSTENVAQAQVLKDVANLYKERIYDGADVKSALTPEVIADLKQKAPNNKAWSKTVDDFVAKAKTPQDLRSFQKPFVRASRFIDNQYAKAAIVGSRTAQSAADLVNIIPATTKAGIIKQAVNVAWNSNPAHRARANLYGKLADRAAANAPTNVDTTAVAPEVIDTNYNPATQIYNAIGRTEGAINAKNAQSANYLADAVKEAEVVPNTGSLEALLSPSTANAQTSVYNSVYGTPTATTAVSRQIPTTGYFQPTGDYWTDLIASAMSSAIDDNNVDAFAPLYGMYQDALSNLQKQNTSSSETKLTATQQRANAAMNSLERLSGMTPDLGYNLSSIPVIGNIATFGGNDYESEAKSLAQQIGYMVSGSNIKDNEAEAIGKAYVPQPWDSEQTRQSKLRRAYEIISQYQNGYAS